MTALQRASRELCEVLTGISTISRVPDNLLRACALTMLCRQLRSVHRELQEENDRLMVRVHEVCARDPGRPLA